jgi:hypothetical protein
LIFLPSTISCEDGEENRLLLESSQRKERNCSEQAATVQRAATEVTGDQSMAVFPIQNGSSNSCEGARKLPARQVMRQAATPVKEGARKLPATARQ